jgi:hypothetical protein
MVFNKDGGHWPPLLDASCKKQILSAQRPTPNAQRPTPNATPNVIPKWALENAQ